MTYSLLDIAKVFVNTNLKRNKTLPRQYHLHDVPTQSPFPTLSLNSAVTGYTTKDTLFISMHLFTDTVSALQEVWVLIRT